MIQYNTIFILSSAIYTRINLFTIKVIRNNIFFDIHYNDRIDCYVSHSHRSFIVRYYAKTKDFNFK